MTSASRTANRSGSAAQTQTGPRCRDGSRDRSTEPRAIPSGSPLGLFAAVLLLVALALRFWSRRQHKNNNNEEHLTQSSRRRNSKTVSNSATERLLDLPHPVGDANSTRLRASERRRRRPLTKRCQPVKECLHHSRENRARTPATASLRWSSCREDRISITADASPLLKRPCGRRQRAVHAKKSHHQSWKHGRA